MLKLSWVVEGIFRLFGEPRFNKKQEMQGECGLWEGTGEPYLDPTWNCRGGMSQMLRWVAIVVWSDIKSFFVYVSFLSIQLIDDLNKWALFLVSPLILETEHIAFVTESIWVQGENSQRPSSSDPVSNMIFAYVL